ncbi:unnamed protein product [Chrysoparadoxa australica]
MLSYKAFAMSQRNQDDPAKLQSAYEAYKAEYHARLDTAFFDTHVTQEWFQQLYHPRAAAEVHAARKSWAFTESKSFTEQLLSSAEAFVTSTSQEADAGTEWSDKTDAAGRSASGAGEVPEAADAKMCTGTKHTVFIRKVPAWCGIKALESKIREEAEGLDRVVLSYAPKQRNNDFARSAWAVFETAALAKAGASKLHKLKLVKEEVVLEADAASNAGGGARPQSFELQAFPHKPHGFLVLDKGFSDAQRLKHDQEQALKLAAALDAEQGITEGFEALAAKKEVKAAFAAAAAAASAASKPSAALLDLACAYLRRVHCFVYYAGTQCEGEGDAMTYKPYKRAAVKAAPAAAEAEAEPVVDEPELPEAAGKEEVMEANRDEIADDHASTEAEAEAEADAEATAEATSVDEKEPAEGTGTEEEAAGAGDGDAKVAGGGNAAPAKTERTVVEGVDAEAAGGSQANPEAAKPVPSAKPASHFAVKVDAGVAARLACGDTSAVLEADLAALQAAEEKETEKWLAEHTTEVEGGHAVCTGLGSCTKKFRSVDFLHKHLRTKHKPEFDAMLHKVALPFMEESFSRDEAKPLPNIPSQLPVGGGMGGPPGGMMGQPMGFGPTPGFGMGGPMMGGPGMGPMGQGPGMGPGPMGMPGGPGFMGPGVTGGPMGPSMFPSRGPPNWGPGGPPWKGGMPRGNVGGNSDRRGTFGGRSREAVLEEPSGPVDPRQITSYEDVDAPKEAAPVLDYGGAFPPPKKKRRRTTLG